MAGLGAGSGRIHWISMTKSYFGGQWCQSMVTNRKTEGKNCWFIGSTRKILGKEMDQDDPRHSHDDYMQVAYYMDGW